MNHRFESDPRIYEFSIWNRWDERVCLGRQEEVERIHEDAAIAIGPDVQEDWIVDEMWIANTLTNAMYAGLVVAMWSEMEHFLKGLMKQCQNALGHTPNDVHRFGEIMSYFLSQVGINLSALPYYLHVDAVRILNNTFKHNDGVYAPVQGQAHTMIDSALLANWKILDADNRIEYSKLPFKELVLACGQFAEQLSSARPNAGCGGQSA
jgi:hypothetical protein